MFAIALGWQESVFTILALFNNYCVRICCFTTGY